MGEYFVSTHDIVRVALVFGNAFIDGCSMRIAQRNSRRSRGDTLPNQLNELQTLFDREL